MNTLSLNEINKTANMDPNLITKHYKLKLMNDFLNIMYLNPKLKQSEIASQSDMSPSTIQRHRNDINMLSQYRINPNNVKKRPKKAKIDDNGDLKRLQMTSNDLKTTSNDNNKKTKTKKYLKGGSIEVNEHYLDKIFKNNNTWILIIIILCVYKWN